ncbi:MAG: DNA topoisomerase IV [Candidatus Wallbacteria bacterium HGW-Wallbacteria-1]|jgi:topoisomerase-4 subunit A|uniref:DNA topoisomerase IV n=1 Tax=Candidatus Wallbacteria bacterium HGW-Wallbacteria-1 TaxID=2013854 RepID=A0A2N1PKB5_9BACT|nr:MAG: DNA topoisomerase IV [Candidatus Wallbacteria bacterium HGW-Wallbacteria-1]
MGKLDKLMAFNFIEYASYVIKERAIPDIDDGLKPVQRRIMHSLFEMDDGKFNKVANVIGHCMKYHPHGDASIGAALVNLASKDFFIDKQGNFGNIFTGDPASAARYIECRLTHLAREVMFNKDITDYNPSYDGRNQEPILLPGKIPTILLLGAEGIAVGLSTKILPHNFTEVLNAQISYLRNEPFTLYPDFPQGGLMDASNYSKGNGKIKSRAIMEVGANKTLKITELPYGTTTESLINSIELAAKKGKIKISSINDFTAEHVEIEIKLARGYHADQTIEALYAFTDCEISLSPSFTVICDGKPIVSDVDYALGRCTDKLVAMLTRELEIERDRLRDLIHKRTLEQIFIEEKIYRQIEKCESYRSIIDTVLAELNKFRAELEMDVTEEDVETLLAIPIRRISRYDIDRAKREIEECKVKRAKTEENLRNIIKFTIKYISALLKKYADLYPRRTKIESFETVDVAEIQIEQVTVGYDPEKGYLGHEVKSEIHIVCSPYDKLVIFFDDGTYRVMYVPEKTFFEKKVLMFRKADRKHVFNCAYYLGGRRDRIYVKRFTVKGFILEKEYHYMELKDVLMYLSDSREEYLTIYYRKKPRLKILNEDLRFDDFLVKGVAARGNLFSSKEASRFKVKLLSAKELERIANAAEESEETSNEENSENSDAPATSEKGSSSESGQKTPPDSLERDDDISDSDDDDSDDNGDDGDEPDDGTDDGIDGGNDGDDSEED